MAKKLNKSLLNEELKKFKLLSEYSFYTEEPKKDDDLILGSKVDEADETPEADQTDDSKTAANAETGGEDLFSTDDTGGDETATDDTIDAATGDETTADDTADAATGDETATDDTTDATGGDETATDDTSDAASGDEVEVDVTQLVKGSEEAKKSADLSFIKTTELLNKFDELEKRVSAMDAISTKIDTLEKEIVKRNPTPVEKLEMRSLSSFPYNIKLSDYWKDVDGYDAIRKDKEPEEYVLTQDDVDSGYIDSSIKQSFDIPDENEENI
jgi:hypothetical protein